MCRNMLPFDWREIRRYGVSLQTVRFMLLRWTQSRSFRHASGTIFLTEFARRAVLDLVGAIDSPTPIIPHGIDPRFFAGPRTLSRLDAGGTRRTFELIYVSIIDYYKHQTVVAQAAAALVARGIDVRLTLIGPAYPPALRDLKAMLRHIDPLQQFVRYLGPVTHAEIHDAYARADIGVFASSCENMPNILLEQMAAGLPIACSNRGPMPEILGEAGVYFDPESAESIANAVAGLIANAELRERKGLAAVARARQYSWRRCAEDTFNFLTKIAVMHPSTSTRRQP
jgi:glycosyltransferase involved in cell wall biosynthesis